MTQSKYLTVPEVSEYTRFCVSTVRQWTRQPDFYPVRRICRKVVIDREDLDRWLSEESKKG